MLRKRNENTLDHPARFSAGCSAFVGVRTKKDQLATAGWSEVSNGGGGGIRTLVAPKG